MGDSAPGSSGNAKARLKMALSRLPDDIIDGDRQEIQAQVDAWRMTGDGHPAPA